VITTASRFSFRFLFTITFGQFSSAARCSGVTAFRPGLPQVNFFYLWRKFINQLTVLRHRRVLFFALFKLSVCRIARVVSTGIREPVNAFPLELVDQERMKLLIFPFLYQCFVTVDWVIDPASRLQESAPLILRRSVLWDLIARSAKFDPYLLYIPPSLK